MLTVMAGLIGAFVVPAATTDQVCEVGRAVLHDRWPARAPDPAGKVDTTNYVDVEHGLFAVCPALRADVPVNYTVADAAAWARANVHVPVRGQPVEPAFVHAIDVPRIAADGKSATVSVRYDCTGLCGGGVTLRYVRTRHGWVRDGEPQQAWVS